MVNQANLSVRCIIFFVQKHILAHIKNVSSLQSKVIQRKGKTKFDFLSKAREKSLPWILTLMGVDEEDGQGHEGQVDAPGLVPRHPLRALI